MSHEYLSKAITVAQEHSLFIFNYHVIKKRTNLEHQMNDLHTPEQSYNSPCVGLIAVPFPNFDLKHGFEVQWLTHVSLMNDLSPPCGNVSPKFLSAIKSHLDFFACRWHQHVGPLRAAVIQSCLNKCTWLCCMLCKCDFWAVRNMQSRMNIIFANC